MLLLSTGKKLTPKNQT